MPSVQTPSRRRIYFIKKSFQARFILRFCLVALLTSLIAGYYIYWRNPESTTIVFKDLRIQTVPTQEFLYPSITMGIVLALMVASILTILLTLVYSHRLGGPIYRFEQILKELEKGDLTMDVQLRKFDQIKEIGTELNLTVQSLRGKIMAIDQAVSELEKLDSKDPRVAAGLQKIRAVLSRFKY